MKDLFKNKTFTGAFVLGWTSFGLAGYSLYKKKTGYFLGFLALFLVTWVIELSEMKRGKK